MSSINQYYRKVQQYQLICMQASQPCPQLSNPNERHQPPGCRGCPAWCSRAADHGNLRVLLPQYALRFFQGTPLKHTPKQKSVTKSLLKEKILSTKKGEREDCGGLGVCSTTKERLSPEIAKIAADLVSSFGIFRKASSQK